MARSDAVLEQYRRTVDADLYREIRELYKAHSKAEDARDIDGLLATLTEDCVYELPQSGHRWQGHEGAARFYTELIGAFPDVQFDLQNIVIGPQGVFEEAQVVGTWRGPWLGNQPTGEQLQWRVMILFPWDIHRRRFRGERVFADPADITSATAPH